MPWQSALFWGFMKCVFLDSMLTCVLISFKQLMEVMPNRDAARAHSIRQQRALNNLTVILASLGPRGRLSMWSECVSSLICEGRNLTMQP